MELYGGIEAGGTKFVCAIGSSPDDIHAEVRFPTTSPQETLTRAVDFFRQYMVKSNTRILGIGIGSFGPLDLNPRSEHYGKLTSTPKAGWSYTPLSHLIREGTGLPVVLDTDVNAAAFGEGIWGAAQGLQDFLYLTIGTGIGGGVIINGNPYHGLVHPEIGHIRLNRDPQIDQFRGACPFHGDCFEGLASGPALHARLGKPAETLPEYHPIWELEAGYIASALNDLICVLSPERIILGGGVMQQKHLFPMIRVRVQQLLNRYVSAREILEHIDEYIVPPALGGRAGVLGAIALAMTRVVE
ncbi:MAG: ROK family protein [Chloroflexota bacterium]